MQFFKELIEENKEIKKSKEKIRKDTGRKNTQAKMKVGQVS